MKISGSQVTSPVAMWLHALEALLHRLKVRVAFRALVSLSRFTVFLCYLFLVQIAFLLEGGEMFGGDPSQTRGL